MYCPKCGKEIEDSSKFCDGCGANLKPNQGIKGNEILNKIFLDVEEVAKKFFSKNSSSIIDMGDKSDSKIGIVFIVINALLFGFVSCLNISQVVNYLCKNIISSVEGALGKLFGSIATSQIMDLFETGVSSSIKGISAPFELFLPLAVTSFIITGLIIGCIYIFFKVEKIAPKQFNIICNYVGLASFPVIIALIINFIIGFIFPYSTIIFFVLGISVSLIYLYEGLKNIFEIEKPIIKLAIILLVVLLVFAITVSMSLNFVFDKLLDTISNETGSFLTDLFGNLF